MEAKELRLGNYVTHHRNIPEHVWELDVNSINDCDPELVDPIPLTEEWLVKYGKTEYGIEVQKNDYPHGDLFIDFNDDGIGCYLGNCADGYIFGKEIKYVHQLQNLYYALTGEELTIK